jgi:hypothetical protein
MEHAGRTMRALARPPSEDRSPRLDWGRIEAWAQQVAAVTSARSTRCSRLMGLWRPRVLWQPTSSQIQTPQLRFLWDYWTKLKGDARLPASRSVDLSALAPIFGYEALLDVVDDGRDFRYRRGSDVIAVLAGYDLTGKLVSEYSIGSLAIYLVESVLAIHRAAYRRAEPLYLERAPMRAAYGCHGLLLPLADDAATVAGFLHGAVPIGAGGLPIPAGL